MKRKLKGTQGETLVEVLASILIGALSVALLFTAVMASARMDKTARETDSKYKEVLAAAEGRTAVIDPFPGSVTDDDKKVTITNGAISKSESVPVTFYGGKDALSYKLP